ncbi:MAG: stage II sporulation protein M [Bacteroidota bacterium]
MRELAFLHQRAEQWKTFESALEGKSEYDSDQLADLFTQVLEDLSYAQTFYPGSNTTSYLQGLAAKAHQEIYKNKPESKSRLRAFWLDELPGIMYTVRKELLVSLVIFVVAISIGTISASQDTGFVRLILGDAYVNKTLENIQNNDPMGIYKSMQPVDMFLAITFNNVRVSFIAFAAGMLFSVGTGYVLFSNGVMLGAFQYMFYERGLLGEALLVVYIHGTLEICAIIIAGCAGIVMGNGLLFPGTYPRITSFIEAARKGAKIVIGLVPVFIVAGFLEGFVTRQTDMPIYLSLFIIISSLVFILWYFILYPIQRYKATSKPNAA